jgi:hypothetical protein
MRNSPVYEALAEPEDPPANTVVCGSTMALVFGFVQARTHDGRSFRTLTPVDELTRKCLAIDVARQLNREEALND